MRVISVIVVCCFATASAYSLYSTDETAGSRSPELKHFRKLPVAASNSADGAELFLDLSRTEYEDAGLSKDHADKSQPLDSWSVIWYIASFGGLIAFFLVVSCSEWCCRRTARRHSACRREQSGTSTSVPVPDTPPPSYDQFAPPSYESLIYNSRGEKKGEYDVYVVPVHALGTLINSKHTHLDAPPSYTTASFHPACFPVGQDGVVPPLVRSELLDRSNMLTNVRREQLNSPPAGTNELPVGTNELNELPVGAVGLPAGTNELLTGTSGAAAGAHYLPAVQNGLSAQSHALPVVHQVSYPVT